MILYLYYVCGWVGVIAGIAGIVTGNVYFMIGGTILLFVYSFQAKKDMHDRHYKDGGE